MPCSPSHPRCSVGPVGPVASDPILEWRHTIRTDRRPPPATAPRSPSMTTTTGAKPHPIFLAGRWVDSPDELVIHNPANPNEPAGSTFNATDEQYEEAVAAAVEAFEVT